MYKKNYCEQESTYLNVHKGRKLYFQDSLWVWCISTMQEWQYIFK